MKMKNLTFLGQLIALPAVIVLVGNLAAGQTCKNCNLADQEIAKVNVISSKPGFPIEMFMLPKEVKQEQSIVDTAVSAGKFKTLVAAVKAAGLVETLSGKGPLTVFAPTDEAFAKLPKGTVETLLKPENLKTLQGILTYHVVPGSVMTADVVKLKKAKTPTLW